MKARKPMLRLPFFVLWCAFLWLAQVQAEDAFPDARDLWLRAAPPGAHMLAAYGTLTNNTGKPQVLIGAYAPDFGMAEIHKTIFVDGMAKMRHQPQIVIQPGESVELKPGGLHIMLMQPQRTFAIGESIKICLIYSAQDGQEDSRVQHLWFEVKRR